MTRRTVLVAVVAFAASGCGDHTVLTGPDAEAAAETANLPFTHEGVIAKPVIYLDGDRVTDVSGLRDMNIEPADIERIEVIKRCAAVARHGEPGSSSLLLIYTKEYEGEVREWDVKYPELGEACRRESERERERA